MPGGSEPPGLIVAGLATLRGKAYGGEIGPPFGAGDGPRRMWGETAEGNSCPGPVDPTTTCGLL